MTNKKKVLVAMSGGVDSSVVAAKMLEEGYVVEGATLYFGKFCDIANINDAKKIASQLNIKHHVIECEKNFEDKVINYFTNDYINGKTPNPCIKCNRELKFKELLDFRKSIDFNYLATGHYAKIENLNNKYFLKKSIDEIKDQSYFLSQLKQEYLQYIKFPLENITKQEVKKIAENIGLFVANKPESQDICFTKGKDYKDIIKNYYKPEVGDIFHINGEKIGEHNGLINYTQGQRKGLGIGGYKEPLFVINIDTEENIVYVGEEKYLYKQEFTINNLNFLISNIELEKEYIFDIKVRSTNKADKGMIIFHKDNKANIKLSSSSRNITKGQVCCFYDNDMVVGSGYIE